MVKGWKDLYLVAIRFTVSFEIIINGKLNIQILIS